jgi:acyl-CoA thioester hydrolase
VKRIRSRIADDWDCLSVPTAVHFSEVDSMKVVWHGHYIRYCETAREEWCRMRELSYHQMESLGSVAPVVRCQLEYLRPAKMGELLTVRVARIPDSQPSLNLFYEIRNPKGDLLCVAETVQVFVDLNGIPFLSAPPAVEAMFAASDRHRPAKRQ